MLTPDQENELTTWADPETSFRVTYPLPLFHEIDFTANESYRRIPRGGIEIGALLFGRSEPGEVKIESFRPIQCEHALGPSFKLSESDLAGLRKQLETAQAERENGGLEVVGWFIAHTRNPLDMNPAEAALFNELLPGAGKITLLIKPEKFKPTLFAFVVRREDGTLPQELEPRTVILPLSNRANQAGEEQAGPAASARAHEEEATAPIHKPEEASAARARPEESAARSAKPDDTARSARPEETAAGPGPGAGEERRSRPVPPAPQQPGDQQNALLRRALISARQMAAAEPEEHPHTTNRPPAPAGLSFSPPVPPPMAPASVPPKPPDETPALARLHPSYTTELSPLLPPSPPPPPMSMLPTLPVPVEPAWPIDAYPAPTFDAGTGARSFERRMTRAGDDYEAQSRLQFAVVMIVAAALGCALGYLAYLQLPSPVIPLNVQPETEGLTVYWPPEQTRSAVYAAIRVNDGEPVPLSSEAKMGGHSKVTSSGDVTKVELIAQHWMRDSRGIVRFVAAPKPAPQQSQTPVKPKRRAAAKPPYEIPRPEEPAETQR